MGDLPFRARAPKSRRWWRTVADLDQGRPARPALFDDRPQRAAFVKRRRAREVRWLRTQSDIQPDVREDIAPRFGRLMRHVAAAEVYATSRTRLAEQVFMWSSVPIVLLFVSIGFCAPWWLGSTAAVDDIPSYLLFTSIYVLTVIAAGALVLATFVSILRLCQKAVRLMRALIVLVVCTPLHLVATSGALGAMSELSLNGSEWLAAAGLVGFVVGSTATLGVLLAGLAIVAMPEWLEWRLRRAAPEAWVASDLAMCLAFASRQSDTGEMGDPAMRTSGNAFLERTARTVELLMPKRVCPVGCTRSARQIAEAQFRGFADAVREQADKFIQGQACEVRRWFASVLPQWVMGEWSRLPTVERERKERSRWPGAVWMMSVASMPTVVIAAVRTYWFDSPLLVWGQGAAILFACLALTCALCPPLRSLWREVIQLARSLPEQQDEDPR